MIMKRALFLLAIAATMLISCTKEEEGTKMSVIDITLTESQWEPDGNAYSVWIDIPQITQRVFENCNVQLMLMETVSDKERYFPLPAVYNCTLDEDNDNSIGYNVFFDYDWTVGGIFI